MRRALVALTLLALLAVPAPAFAAPGAATRPAAGAGVDADSYCADAEEWNLLGAINDYRAQNGLPALALSATLGAAARHHSDSMATYNYFDGSHNLHFEGPNQDQEITWQENIAEHGYPDNTHTSRAENLAAGFETAAETLAQWRNSPSHNEHLLSPKYQAIGIGRAFNPDAEYRWYWTVTFGSLLDTEAGPCADVAAAADTPGAGALLPITRSGRNGSSTESDVAYDGDEATAWHTTKARVPVSGYIWFDLGDTRSVSKVEALFSESGGADAVEIQVSSDREDWQTVAELSAPAPGEWQTIDWAGEARYVRFWFTNPNDAPVLGYLAEVRIYG